MKPYYSDEQTTIYCGDAFDILPQLEVGCVDICLTDPDYNAKDIGIHSRTYKAGMMHLSPEEYAQFCQKWFAEVQRITPNIIFTPGIRNAWNYPSPKWVIAWHKPGSKCFNATGGFNIWEPILLYGKVGPFVEDFISRVPNNLLKDLAYKNHPCPKTIQVWDWLIAHGTKAGQTVLDCFGGSGTSAVCCKKQGRKSILIEIEEKYCEVAVKRLAQTVMQLDIPPSPPQQAQMEG